MQIVSIVNPKGGTAKTETAKFLAYGLAERGKRVLALDFNPLTHMFNHMGNSDSERDDSQDEYVVQGIEINDDSYEMENAIYHLKDNLDITYITYNTHYDMLARKNPLKKIEIFREMFKSLDDKYDYCVIDSKPGSDAILGCLLAITQDIIIPTDLEEDSVDSIDHLYSWVQIVKSEKNINPELVVSGILITRWIENIDYDNETINRIKEFATSLETKIYRTPIRNSLFIQKAKREEKFLKEVAPEAPVTRDYLDFVDEFIEQSEGNTNVMQGEEKEDKETKCSNEKPEFLYINLTLKQQMAVEALAKKNNRSKAYIINKLLEKALKINASDGIDFQFALNGNVSWSGNKKVPKDIKRQILVISEEHKRSMTFIVMRLIEAALDYINL